MTRQFDVMHNPMRTGRESRPYVLVIQHDFLDELRTRVVVPLVVPSAMRMQSRLNPELDVLGQKLYLSPAEPFSLPTRLLRGPVANLEHERYRIVAALDLVFTGI